MIHSRIAALGVAGALALGLAACGGGSSNTGGSTSGDDASTTQSQAAAAPASTTAEASDAPGGLTAPGTKLALGQQANVGWVPPSRYTGSGGQQGYKLQVTVKSIERGTLDDFKNIQLDADQKSSTPYYVSVSVKALEDVKVGTDDPDISFDAIDDRGQEQGSITFLGEFERCNDTRVPRSFTSGTSYDSCLAYLMPGGGSIDAVQWRSGPSRPNEVTPYFSKPIMWSGS